MFSNLIALDIGLKMCDVRLYHTELGVIAYNHKPTNEFESRAIVPYYNGHLGVIWDEGDLNL